MKTNENLKRTEACENKHENIQTGERKRMRDSRGDSLEEANPAACRATIFSTFADSTPQQSHCGLIQASQALSQLRSELHS